MGAADGRSSGKSLQTKPAPFLYGGWLANPRFATPSADGLPFAMTAPHSAGEPSSGTATTLPPTDTDVVRANPSSRRNTPGARRGAAFFGAGRGASGLTNRKTATACGASSFATPSGVKRAWTG